MISPCTFDLHFSNDSNGKDLTEAEEVKKMCQEYAEEVFKKVLMIWRMMML